MSALRDNSWHSIMARNVEVDRGLEADSMHQHKQDFQLQLGAPTPSPEERAMERRKMEMPMAQHKSQHTVESFNPEKKLQQKQGLPAKVDQTLQDATTSASLSRKPQKTCDMRPLVLPTMRDPLFLDRAVKSQLEKHIVKMKIQRRYRLPTKVLEYERNSEDTALIQEAAQPPAMQRHSLLPYHSPSDRWDRLRQSKKEARDHSGPQKEFADPVDSCSGGNEVPTQSGTAAFVGRPKEMAQQDGETPPWKRKHGVLAGGSKAGSKTLPGTAGKEQGPGTQGYGNSPARSGQAKWVLPQSKGAPQGQSDQGSESPSVSWGHMAPPELPLENSVPVQEVDHSMEGHSISSEDVGTPELPSNVAAPLSKSSPQAQRPSFEKRPSVLTLSPDSAGTSLMTPFIRALANYLRTKQVLADLCNQLWPLCQEQHPDKTELPLESHSPGGAQKGTSSAQESARCRRLCPRCSKAPHQHQVMVKRSLCEFDWPQLQSAPGRYLHLLDCSGCSDLRVRHTGGLRRAQELRHFHQKSAE